MPLHIDGLDEASLKILAKRYRAALLKKATDPATVPALMQIQEDLVVAMGHKDMHAAKAYWKTRAEEDPEEADERGVWRDVKRQRQDRERQEKKQIQSAILAMGQGEDAFARSLQDNALVLLNLRNEHGRRAHPLLVHAITHGHDAAALKLLAIGEKITSEDFIQAFNAAPLPQSQQLALVAHMDDEAARHLFSFFGAPKAAGAGHGKAINPLSHEVMQALYGRIDLAAPMGNLDNCLVEETRRGNVAPLERWLEEARTNIRVRKEFIRSCCNRGFADTGPGGYLLTRDRLPEILVLVALADASGEEYVFAANHGNDLREQDQARREELRKNGREEFVAALLHQAACLARLPALDWALEQSPSQEALNSAAVAAWSLGADPALARLLAAGARLQGGWLARPMANVVARLPQWGVDEVIRRIDQLLQHNTAPDGTLSMPRKESIIIELVRSPMCSQRPQDVVRVLKHLMAHGLDINDCSGYSQTSALEEVSTYPRPETVSAILVLIECGADPALTRRGNVPLITRLALREFQEIPGVAELAQRVARMPGVFDRKPDMLHPLSAVADVAHAKRLVELGAQFAASDLLAYLQGSGPEQQTMQLAMVEWSATQGVDFGQVLDNGTTLLHQMAAKSTKLPVLEKMLRLGANPKAKDKKGVSVEEHAGEAARALLALHTRRPARRQ